MCDTGRELSAETAWKSAVASDGGAETGAVHSPDPLAAFVATLTPDQRRRLADLLIASATEPSAVKNG
jgi:hypothetical protein